MFKVERLLKERVVKDTNGVRRRQFLVLWMGYAASQATWEFEENILDPALVNAFRAGGMPVEGGEPTASGSGRGAFSGGAGGSGSASGKGVAPAVGSHRRMCGTPGCKLPDDHQGNCTLQQPPDVENGKRIRQRKPEPASASGAGSGTALRHKTGPVKRHLIDASTAAPSRKRRAVAGVPSAAGTDHPPTTGPMGAQSQRSGPLGWVNPRPAPPP